MIEDLKYEEVMQVMTKDFGYEPEQLELNFSDGDNAWFPYEEPVVPCPFCRRVVAIPFTYDFCSNECLEAYNKKWNIKYPLWRRLLLLPFKLLCHVGLFIVSVIALLTLMIMSLNRFNR